MNETEIVRHEHTWWLRCRRASRKFAVSCWVMEVVPPGPPTEEASKYRQGDRFPGGYLFTALV